jgi:hypothetical protein
VLHQELSFIRWQEVSRGAAVLHISSTLILAFLMQMAVPGSSITMLMRVNILPLWITHCLVGPTAWLINILNMHQSTS